MHIEPTEHAARHHEAQGRRADRHAALFTTMKQHVIDAIRAGRDERLPSVSDRPGAEGQMISQWLSSCDAEQERLLFNLVHLTLNGANLDHIHEAGQKLAEYVARDFAELFVEGRS